MITQIINSKLFKDSRISGVDIEIYPDEKIRCFVVILEKKKGCIHVIEKLECSIAELSNKLSPKIPLCISIDGKGMLSREFKHTALSDEQIILEAFPNIIVSDYYVHQTQSEKESIIAYFARKSVVDSIIQQINLQNFSILQISLGCLSVAQIASFVEKEEIKTKNYSIEIKNGFISNIEKKESLQSEFAEFGDEKIPSLFVIAFATAFGYFSSNMMDGIHSEVIEEKIKDYKYIRFMKKGGFIFLITLFIVLLINFFIFSYQSEKQKELSQELSLYQETLDELNTSKKEIAEKEKLLGTSSLSKNTYFSYYADRIAASKPQGIVLEQMHLFPITLKNKKFDPDGIRKDTITISGNTQNSLLLNEWVKELQKEAFIRHINITNYSQIKDSQGIFSLEIAVNPREE